MQQARGKLYLIPNFLAPSNPEGFLPEYVREAVHHITTFIVENEKEARALIKRLHLEASQQELTIRLWNEHSRKDDLRDLLQCFSAGDVGLITDAGIPCVADPGSDVVAMAHRHGVDVIPLPGASSILMALMSSGLNGQSFAFNGYLPVDRKERVRKLLALENLALSSGQTQLFMEAPYRNNHLLEDLLKHCSPNTRLCIASMISDPAQLIRTATVKEWRMAVPDLHKKPTIFVLGQ